HVRRRAESPRKEEEEEDTGAAPLIPAALESPAAAAAAAEPASERFCGCPRPFLPPALSSPYGGARAGGRTLACAASRRVAAAAAAPLWPGERAAGAMGERLRSQQAGVSSSAATAATPTCSLRNGLQLHNGFHHRAMPSSSNGEASRALLFRQDLPLPSQGSPAKKGRTRRRMDSGRKNRPRKCEACAGRFVMMPSSLLTCVLSM
uniref:Uncharacterized protein n=1 Tax=Salvator merianae TaxID=96440 RepID=A0A8D0BWV7_SALMN